MGSVLLGQQYIRWIAVVAILIAAVMNLTAHVSECSSLTDHVIASVRGSAVRSLDTAVAVSSPIVGEVRVAAGNGPDAAPLVIVAVQTTLLQPIALAVSGKFDAPFGMENSNSPLAHKASSVLLI